MAHVQDPLLELSLSLSLSLSPLVKGRMGTRLSITTTHATLHNIQYNYNEQHITACTVLFQALFLELPLGTNLKVLELRNTNLTPWAMVRLSR